MLIKHYLWMMTYVQCARRCRCQHQNIRENRFSYPRKIRLVSEAEIRFQEAIQRLVDKEYADLDGAEDGWN